ncbi:MAG: rhodanese [Deltaproteobacteria bacterium CG23_combo_of_CG06-09_8_20_14_all_60_8]|nr:MAG: rhodanese [Deltaproteobacteria bacterium CG23_combo_of_CG06-09_8_20_14_all_60_8]
MKRPWLVMITLWALACGILAGGVASAATPPPAATPESLRQEAAKGGYRLITGDEVRAMQVQDPGNLLLVDTRQDWEYAAGHIEGAVNFPMAPTWLSRLTKRGEMAQLLGPDKGRHIVFY